MMKEKSKIRIGIVGAGGVAQAHAEAIGKNADCNVMMVADVVEEKAQRLAQICGARAYTDYRDFCNGQSEKPDVVILNLPHDLHCEAAIYFLSHKIHVLVEKPMAMNKDECMRMIRAANQYGARLGVGHVQQYVDAHDIVKGLIESGKYGRLVRITEIRDIDYFDGRPDWFLDRKRSGGGIVMNYCAHTLDKIFYMTGETPEEVHCVLSNYYNDCSIEEGAQILLRFSGGISAAVSYSGGRVPYTYETRLYFTQGAVLLRGEELFLYEDGAWKSQGGNQESIFEKQIAALVDWVNGVDSKIAAPEYGMEIIECIEKIVNNEVLRG